MAPLISNIWSQPLVCTFYLQGEDWHLFFFFFLIYLLLCVGKKNLAAYTPCWKSAAFGSGMFSICTESGLGWGFFFFYTEGQFRPFRKRKKQKRGAKISSPSPVASTCYPRIPWLRYVYCKIQESALCASRADRRHAPVKVDFRRDPVSLPAVNLLMVIERRKARRSHFEGGKSTVARFQKKRGKKRRPGPRGKANKEQLASTHSLYTSCRYWGLQYVHVDGVREWYVFH